MTAVLNPPKAAPSITAADYALVKEQYGKCILCPTFFDDFYKVFTSKSPEINRLFANTEMSEQKHALRAGLTFLIMFAEGQAAFAADKLDKIGSTHKKTKLNIRPDMYPMWIQSLVATVKKHVPEFNDVALKAWTAVLQHGVNRIVSHYND
jgi:hemoglobin-like flavoprotein